MSMQSQTLKIITIMFCGLFGITWMILSVKNGVMVEPPASIVSGLTVLVTGKIADGVVGKMADRRGGA